MNRMRSLSFCLVALLVALAGLGLGACAAPPTPTPIVLPPTPTPITFPTPLPTPTPMVFPTAVPTPTLVPPTPTPSQAIRWGPDGRLLPLPDGFPRRSIQISTPQMGSSSDIDTRSLVAAAENLSPVPISIVNDGPDHDVCFIYAKKQVGFDDGYWLNTMSGSMLPYYYTKATGVGLADYKAIVMHSTSPIFYAVKADAPWKTLAELKDYAKANPGKLRIVSGGTGNWNHVIAYWWPMLAGVEAVVVPVAMSGEAVLTVLGGGAEVASVSAGSLMPQIKAGKMRALATVEGKRVPSLPDVPTFKESGYDMDYSHFRGLICSSKVPDQRIEWLSTLFVAACDQPELKNYVAKQGEFILGWGGKQAYDYLVGLDKVSADITLKTGMREEKK